MGTGNVAARNADTISTADTPNHTIQIHNYYFLRLHNYLHFSNWYQQEKKIKNRNTRCYLLSVIGLCETTAGQDIVAGIAQNKSAYVTPQSAAQLYFIMVSNFLKGCAGLSNISIALRPGAVRATAGAAANH